MFGPIGGQVCDLSRAYRSGQDVSAVKELLRTNDIVLLSFARATLQDHGMRPIVLDSYMSVAEGSLGVLPRRLMIEDDDERKARLILNEHGIECPSDV